MRPLRLIGIFVLFGLTLAMAQIYSRAISQKNSTEFSNSSGTVSSDPNSTGSNDLKKEDENLAIGVSTETPDEINGDIINQAEIENIESLVTGTSEITELNSVGDALIENMLDITTIPEDIPAIDDAISETVQSNTDDTSPSFSPSLKDADQLIPEAIIDSSKRTSDINAVEISSDASEVNAIRSDENEVNSVVNNTNGIQLSPDSDIEHELPQQPAQADSGSNARREELPARPSVKAPRRLPRQKPYGTNLPLSPSVEETSTTETEASSLIDLDQSSDIAINKVYFAQGNHQALKTAISNHPNGAVEVARGDNGEERLKFPFKVMPYEWIREYPVMPYPQQCTISADNIEFVTVRFRVNRQGKATRPAITSTSNSCFSTVAKSVIQRMEFRVRAPRGHDFGGSTFLLSFIYQKPSTTASIQ